MDRFSELYESLSNAARTIDQQGAAWKRNSCLVYVIELNGFYKIGRTTRMGLNRRMGEIQSGFPGEENIRIIKLFHFDLSKECGLAERTFHDLFSESRLKGEWFSLSTLELAKIISMNESDILKMADRENGQLNFFAN